MERKFECINCHHHFSAEDTGNVSCPNCKSDNVRPAKSGVGALVGSVAFLVVFTVVGWFVGGLFTGGDYSGNVTPALSSDNQDPKTTVAGKSVTENSDATDAPIVQIDIDEPLNVVYDSNPVGSGEGESTVYSFKAWVEKLPDNAQVKEFQVTSNNDETKIVKKAGPDGKFSGVPYSPDNGNYKLFAVLTTGQKSEAKPISGFEFIPVKIAKLTAGEMQTFINNRDFSITGGSNPQIVRSPKLKYTNLQGDHPYNNIEDVLMALTAQEWSSVTVNSLGYDSHNRVNLIEMTIVYP